ncbi:MAG: Xaa-Pro peptidase family protein [Coriobacteriales bacterium]|jgi:Xaa-Pro aminopeptidase|nr:Xaa-Pro peptidase family protein [Coriobacteriales bacterium]
MSELRLRRLANALSEKGVDICLVTHTADIRWLTGFAGVFDEEQAHMALIARGAGVGAGSNDGGSASLPVAPEPVLFTDTRYSAALRQLDTQKHWRILDERRPRSSYLAEVLTTEPLGTVLNTVASEGSLRAEPLRIGIENDLPLNVWRALSRALDERKGLAYELVELPAFITGLRAVKDVEEIALLKAAQIITDAAFTHMLDYLRPGITEREAATELEFFMRRSGAQSVAFPSIVASGPNSAVPHAVPGERVLERGDFVLMDFGARLGDYRSDMTRTLVLGRASNQQRAMYAAALAAQTAVIDALRPGMSGREAQALADEVIAAHGFDGKLIHSLGHGVGIDIHELPVLASKVEATLEVGHVVTVEPGVYIEGSGGVRIEDFGIITEHGFENFTHSLHELIEL